MHTTSRLTIVSFTLPLIALLSFVILFALPGVSYGQTTLAPGAQSSLALEPAFPSPNSDVTVSLDAYSLDTTGATISWYHDGVEMTQFKNARSAVMRVGSIGKKSVVSASIKLVNTPAFTLRKEITPTAVDIVIEASTYVPSFYRGRALPGEESRVRVIAIPHVGGTDPQTLTYRWEQNGSVLLGGPIRGRQGVELTVSRYYGGYVGVTIFDANGKTIAQKNITFDSKSPELHFYEENPLRGLSERALTGSFTLIGEETTVHGEPYFMNAKLMSGITTYGWTINGSKAANGNPDPHIITLRKTGGAGSARVGLQAVNDTGIPVIVNGDFVINF